MSEILCRWLNEDIQLSENVDPNNFAERFANGYLLGELLYRNGLQDDFEQFSELPTSEAKLLNFTRIQPTMALLDVKFNTNMAQEIINQQPGVATRLIYQLFIALGKKNKLNLTGVAMETMRPSAAARLGVIETDMYKERLKTLVPRQVDLDFDDLVAKYNRKQKEQEDQARVARLKEEDEIKQIQQELRQKDLQRSRQIREQQEETMAKIKEATVKIPKPPEKKKHGKTKHEIMKEREIENVYSDISNFEKSLKHVRGISSPESSDQIREIDADIEQFLRASPKESTRQPVNKPEANDHYIQKIRHRLDEDVNARKEREKRRRRVLIEQMKAHEAQQQFTVEEMLVSRLMRQSQVERRIAVQLMNTRKQKDEIKKNRLEREKQYTERRMKDFQDALDREAEMCRQAKLEYANEIQRTQELHDLIAKERALKKYEKHYNLCKDILLDIVDFSCKLGEYRELTDNMLPAKIVREWKALFTNGKPLYNEPCKETSAEDSEQQAFEESKQALLDEEDFLEYQNSVGEWKPLVDSSDAPANNAVLGHILKTLDLILYPPTPPPAEPEFPEFPIKACVLGKCFAGKTSAIREMTRTHRIVSLDIESAVHFAIQAYQNKECIEQVPDVEVSTAEEVVLGEGEAVSVEIVGTGDIVKEPPESEQGVKSEVTTPQITTAPTNNDNQQQPSANDSHTTSNGAAEDGETGSGSIPTPVSTALTESAGKSQATDPESNLSVEKEPAEILTYRAKLGGKASHYLKKGKVLPDTLLVDIIVDHIRSIPDGTGWILDGFPATVAQAKLLEKALTGYSPEPSLQKLPGKEKRGKKSKLAHDLQTPPETKLAKSGIDVLVVFDIADEVSLKRAEGRKMNPESYEEYHEEFNPPPDGYYTGLQNKSKVRSVIDDSNDKEQIQIRLISYQDNWPKLEKWFGKFDIMTKIDADVSQEEAHTQLKDVLNNTVAKLAATAEEEKRKEEEAIALAAAEKEAEAKKAASPPAEPTASAAEAEMDKAEDKELEKERVSSSKKGGKRGKDSPSPTKKGKDSPGKKGKESPGKKGKESPSPQKKGGKGKGKEGSPSPTKKDSRGATRKGSAESRKGSAKRSRSRSKEKATVEDTVPVAPEEPPAPPSPEPGTLEWVYVDRPIDKDFVEILLSNWEVIEEAYISSSKHMFREIRQENETIYRYFYETRKNFIQFLKRPDEKQIFVTDWQKSYNKFPEDIRNDDEAKCELHQRVDDLCDRLWDICDTRKEEAEKECQSIMTEQWLEDHVGLLINHYISLMQMEADRYQATCKLLKDYYVAMEGGPGPNKLKLITEGPSAFTRLPLVELPPTLPPAGEDKGTDEDIIMSQSTVATSVQGSKVKTPEPAEEKKMKIPLIPQTAGSTDTSPSREKKKSAPKKESKMGTEEEASPIPPCDVDEKLLHDATTNALQLIEIQNNTDLADDEAEANAKVEKPVELTKTNSKEKKGKKEKGGGNKTPSKTSKINMQAQPADTGPQDNECSEEEKEKKTIHEKMSKEYKKAVSIEGSNLKIRVEGIKDHSISVVKKLKEKAQKMYTDMDDWLGKRFQEEMESIDKMCEVIRLAIEEERQLQDASVLEDKEFFIDDDVHIFKTPTPEPVPSPREDMFADLFTCVQLEQLAKQFKEISPDGLLSAKSFITVIQDLQLSPAGLETLPEKWMMITNQQIEQLASILSIRNAYLNWKFFVLLLAHPYPVPTQKDLMDALQAYREFDTANHGRITKDEFKQISIWLDSDSEVDALADAYDRAQSLKMVFFDVFCTETSEGYLLDYQDMLLYFSVDNDAFTGLTTALALVTGTPMFDNHTFFQQEDQHGQETEEMDKDGDGEKSEGEDEDQTKDPSWNVGIGIEDWLRVFNHGERALGGDHRFNLHDLPPQHTSQEILSGVYKELGFADTDAIALHLLYAHPIMQEIIDSCVKYETMDIHRIFDAPEDDGIDNV